MELLELFDKIKNDGQQFVSRPDLSSQSIVRAPPLILSANWSLFWGPDSRSVIDRKSGLLFEQKRSARRIEKFQVKRSITTLLVQKATFSFGIHTKDGGDYPNSKAIFAIQWTTGDHRISSKRLTVG